MDAPTNAEKYANLHAIDTAWRTHEAIRDWTGKAEAKASFALLIESAMVTGTITLSMNHRLFSALSGASLTFYVLGIAFLAIAISTAIFAVVPQIRRRPAKKTYRDNWVFFGHLRFWENPEDLVSAWKYRDVLPVLARQAIFMSRVAWRKHRLLQASLIAATLSAVALVVAGSIA
jgi:hypothetical protein